MWFNFDSEDCWVVNFRVETANHPFVQGADDYLQTLEAVDAALIFEGQTQLDQVLVLTAACFPMGGFEPGISDCAYSKVSALVGNVSLLFGLGVELNWYKTIFYQLRWCIEWSTLAFTSRQEHEDEILLLIVADKPTFEAPVSLYLNLRSDFKIKSQKKTFLFPCCS